MINQVIILKINIISDLEYIIYLYNLTSDFEFNNEENIEKFLRQLFIKLKNFYNITIEGYFDVDVYIDDYYGMVLDLKKEIFEYYDYFDNQVEMKIVINKCKFLFLVDYFDFDKNKYDVYKYLDKIYLLPKIKINKSEMSLLMEMSTLIFNSNEIFNNGKKIIVQE